MTALQNQQLQYLSQSVILEESVSPKLVRTTMLSISVLLLSFLTWAAITPVSEVAKGSGEVIPVGYIQAIQHLDGGKVSAILVQEGQLVEKGQPVMQLEGADTKSEFAQMSTREQALQLKIMRLRAFMDDSEPDFSAIAQDVPQLAHEERQILNAMRDDREKKRQILVDQIAAKQKELDSIRNRRTTLHSNIRLADEENTMRKHLLEKGYTSKLSAIDSERRLNTARGDLQDINSQEKVALEAINEAKSRLQSLDSELSQNALKEIGAVQAELSELDRVKSNLSHRVDNLEVRSPVRGLVKGITVTTLGAVVSPGQTLMEIVPVDQDLIVETSISPRDIGHAQAGQHVSVKVTSYDFVRYGSIDGTLESISPSTYNDPDGGVYYKGRVVLAQNYVGKDPSRNVILPGMTVQADIITGKKTLLEYFLKPIHLALQTSFQER